MVVNDVVGVMSVSSYWSAHCHVVGGEWYKTLVNADEKGVWGPGLRTDRSLWVAWDSVKDIDIEWVRGWKKRASVAIVRHDGSKVRLLVSSPNWWGFYPPSAAVEAANALRECKYNAKPAAA